MIKMMTKVGTRLRVICFVMDNLLGTIDKLEKKNEDEEFRDFLKFCFVNMYEIKEEYEKQNTLTYKFGTLALAILVLFTGVYISDYIPEGYNYTVGFFVAFIYFSITNALR